MIGAIAKAMHKTTNLQTLDELFKSEYREDPIKFDVDPLVLSVRLKKLKETDPTQWHRLEHPSVKSQLMGDDFNDAQSIKEYYSKKLMWSSLKDSKMSAYRTHLISLLSQVKSTLTKKEVGMIVTLPYFYAEDQIMDSIAKNYQVVDCPAVKPNLKKLQRELVYIHQTTRWVNKKKFIFYWFADDNNFVYNIQLDEGNLLRKFFEDIVLIQSTTKFETHITKVDYPFDYYKMFDFRMIK
jgi:predicted DNA-binding protein YlxM (UPF0122 family)